MTGTYAAAFGPPWLRFAGGCGPTGFEAADWFAKMTGRRGHRGQHWGQHSFAGWGAMGNPPPFPPWARGQRGPKARRGDVRAAILAVLADQSLNGYQIIQEIADRSGGVWKPSPGSIYPTLQQLEDEGLVQAEETAGRRAFKLTEEGRRYVAEHADEVAAPWEAMAEPDDGDDHLKPLIGQIAAAVWQIVAVGTPEQQKQGREALIELRRKLYAILSSDETDEQS
jgi:DNA-binding PadR family transcriptional regulator